MNTFIWGVVIILLAGVVFGFIAKKKPKLIIDQAREKAGNLEKIREMLERMNKITNDDVVRELGVSSSTVTSYMDELERGGEAKQVGREGKYVYYERTN